MNHKCADNSDADQIIASLRGVDPNFLLVDNIKIGEFILCISRLQARVYELESMLDSVAE